VTLASFNGDAIAGMTPEQFAAGWAAWCAEYSPKLPARLGVTPSNPALSHRWLWLAQAVKQRAKTFADAAKPAAFVLLDDHAVAFDAAAVEKHLLANDKAGYKLLQAFASRFEALSSFEPKPIHDLIEAMVAEFSLPNMGPLAQAIRVAIAGAAVSPPLGESLAVLGRESTMARLNTCLKKYA
jgi:glutamyl-tRNA synthetase